MPISAPTLDQRRARHAWDAVERIKNTDGPIGSDYAREVKRLPVRIFTAGLGHAIAFLRAKGKDGGGDANAALLCDLADWVLDKRRDGASRRPAPTTAALIEAIVKGDATFLQVSTDEALAYLQWLGRFAEAELKSAEE